MSGVFAEPRSRGSESNLERVLASVTISDASMSAQERGVFRLLFVEGLLVKPSWNVRTEPARA